MASSSRNLTLTEELEKLEQSITLTLQGMAGVDPNKICCGFSTDYKTEIDHNFSKAHRIVTSGIIPAAEQYARHSGQVWEGSKVGSSIFEVLCETWAPVLIRS